MIDIEQAVSDIREELCKKRAEWKKVREERLNLKKELMSQGAGKLEIRKNSGYKKLEKDQTHLTTVIKHIEKRLNRKMARLIRNEKNP